MIYPGVDEVRGWRWPDRAGQGPTRVGPVAGGAKWFAQEVPVHQIAQRLRVSTNAVYVWRRRWRAGGPEALMSKGPSGSACQLDEQRGVRPARALEAGPAAAYGFGEDQRWSLARVADLIARLFHIRYTLCGVSYLSHRMGFSPQVPVSGKGSGRISVAGLVCLKPGRRSRLIYRTRTHRGRKGERRSFDQTGYAALAEAEAVASVGSRGDSYDNAMAEAFNSLVKGELIHNPIVRGRGWQSVRDVEIAYQASRYDQRSEPTRAR